MNQGESATQLLNSGGGGIVGGGTVNKNKKGAGTVTSKSVAPEQSVTPP